MTTKQPVKRASNEPEIRIATDEDLARFDAEPDPEFMARVRAAEIQAALTPRLRPVGYEPFDIDPTLLR